MDTEFSSQGAPSAVPTKQEIDTIESVVREILSDFLIATGIDPSQFNLITSPFNANQTGFDRVIDVVKVQYDDQSGNVTVVPVDPENNTPGEPLAEIGSNEPISSIPDMKTAINAGLSEFKNTVNSKGCTLQTSDIQPYLEQDFLWRGMNADIFTDDIVLKVSYLAVMRTILKTDR